MQDLWENQHEPALKLASDNLLPSNFKGVIITPKME